MNTTNNIKVEIKTITPELAQDYLKLNTGNRPISERHVLHLAREIKNGRWALNGDTICINGERLVDGQHRLAAIVKAGIAVQSLVVEGISSDVFPTKDIGKNRSKADTLSTLGEVNAKNLAASLVMIDDYMKGQIGNKAIIRTNSEVVELLPKYPEARDSVRSGLKAKKVMPPSVMSACHYLFSRKDQSAADSFLEDLVQGINLKEGDPVYILRERLLSNSLAKAKLSSPYIMAITIKAWNHRRAGLTVRYLRYREEGDRPEAFPIVM